jgi:hypothetical protein
MTKPFAGGKGHGRIRRRAKLRGKTSALNSGWLLLLAGAIDFVPGFLIEQISQQPGKNFSVNRFL